MGNDVGILKDECLSKMRNIFHNFNESMQRLGRQDVYVGDTSESFQARFNKLKTRFQYFENLVNKFAEEFGSF